MTAQQIQGIEREVNKQILLNLPVVTREMPVEEAKATGAMAFFGDKYGDVVRLVSMGDFSLELCGGTHCQRTGDIGQIKILSESGIGSGLRRIEAVTGTGALQYHQQQEEKLAVLATLLKARPDNIEKRLEQVLKENKTLTKEIEKLQAKSRSRMRLMVLWEKATDLGGVKLLTAQVKAGDMPTLPQDFRLAAG